ncbi:9-O-acetylesterase [Opitutaceae bacterium TAV4]|nr:9-O-acetylesterase [Opitutaceae bacterium TAV4]
MRLPHRLASPVFLLIAIATLAAIGLSTTATRADVVLPSVFSEHMVLQRSAATPIWGRAEPGEKITLTLTPQLTRTTTADANGRWRIDLDLSDTARLPAGPHQLTLRANNTLTIPDVLIGEVWLASGQSNMARTMSASASKDEIAASTNTQIRFFTAARKASPTPLADVSGKWTIAAPDTTPAFSAVAYYFARQLQAELNTPFGIIHSSWGGTPVEAWTSQTALANNPTLAPQALKNIEAFAAFPAEKTAWLATLKPWLAANQREDLPPPPPATLTAYTTAPATAGTDGWTTVRLPGKLPGERILWIRRDITVPQSAAGKPLTIDIDEIVGIDTVYLDGKKIGGRTLDTYDGDGRGRLNARRQYRVPSADVTAGTHTLAIRIYAPLGESAINAGYFTAGSQSLSGNWLLKTEHAFPALTAAARATNPGSLKAPLRPWNVPASLYNGMIDPLVPYALRGFIWYQGENDAGNPTRYAESFPQLINDWRARWNDSGLASTATPLSFYWCQLPNYQNKPENPNASPGWAGIRESQTRTLSLPRTGQAVLIDVGEGGDVHPKSKREAGARLAALALANDYGKTDTIATGPAYDRMSIEGSAIRIHFKNTNTAATALVAKPVPSEHLWQSVPNRVTKPIMRPIPDSQLEGFIIRGATGSGSGAKWHWASATIDPATNTVLVSSPEVPKPQAVRYAWFSNPTCNLYNAAGFPACPFRTDTD